MDNRKMPADVTQLMYETRNGENILTLKFLKRILKFENTLLRAKNYQQFCVIMHDHCLPTRSLPRLLEDFLDYSKKVINGSDLEENLQRVIFSYHNEDKMRPHLLDFIAKSYKITSKNVVFSTALRSYHYVAWVNVTGGYTTRDYARNVLHPLLYTAAREKPIDGIDFTYFNIYLYFDYLKIQVVKDLLLAVGSFIFIFCFLWFQTKSLFIAVAGIYGIVTNFCGANLVYRYIFDYRYFGVFHVLAIFIILGIGVDDIFVFNDAWVHTKTRGISNIYERLIICYHKASTSMLVTSVTTAVAFYVNAFSPLLAIRSFGIFSGTLVVVNYISVITYFATVIIVQESISSCGKVAPKEDSETDRAVKDNLVNELLSAEIDGSIGVFEVETDQNDPELLLKATLFVDQNNETNNTVNSITIPKNEDILIRGKDISKNFDRLKNFSFPSRSKVLKQISRFYLVLINNPTFQVISIFSGILLVSIMAYASTLIKIDDKKVGLCF